MRLAPTMRFGSVSSHALDIRGRLAVLVLCRQAGLVALGQVALEQAAIDQAKEDQEAGQKKGAVVNTNADCPQVLGLVDQVRANRGRKPDACSADAGHGSEANLAGLLKRHIRAYIATGRQKHGSKDATHAKNGKPGSLIAAMKMRLKRGGCENRWSNRCLVRSSRPWVSGSSC